MSSKKREAYQGRESDFQKAMARYLDQLGVLWFHPPNGGKRNAREAGYLKAEGVKAGVPDMCIMEPRGDYHGLFIELKTKANKPQPMQKRWAELLNERGYLAIWVNNIDDAVEQIHDYLSL